MAVPGAASAPAVRGPPAPLLCRAPSIPHGLIRSARVGAGLKRPGWCSGGGLGEANEFHGLDSCRDGGRRVPAPWPWKGGSLAAPKAPGPPNLEPKCRGRRSRPPSSKAPTFFCWGGRPLRVASKLKAAPRGLALAALLGSCFQRCLSGWLRSLDASAGWFHSSDPVTVAGKNTFAWPMFDSFAGNLQNPRHKGWEKAGRRAGSLNSVILKREMVPGPWNQTFLDLAGPLGLQDAGGWLSRI